MAFPPLSPCLTAYPLLHLPALLQLCSAKWCLVAGQLNSRAGFSQGRSLTGPSVLLESTSRHLSCRLGLGFCMTSLPGTFVALVEGTSWQP